MSSSLIEKIILIKNLTVILQKKNGDVTNKKFISLSRYNKSKFVNRVGCILRWGNKNESVSNVSDGVTVTVRTYLDGFTSYHTFTFCLKDDISDSDSD